MMFWREREKDNSIKELNGGPLCGQVRVLVVGDSGVGKTSLVQLMINGSSFVRPSQTIGCSVDVKHITYGSPSSSSNSLKGDAERDFFVELWDISGHERYRDCRSLFYNQINGVIFVYDLSQRRTKTSLHKWAAEVAATGTFSAPMSSGGPGGLPVPYIVISNKADLAVKGHQGSSGNLVDVARQWVEKQGLLPPSEELPLTESFPGNGALLAAAKEARYDKEAVTKFFRLVCVVNSFFNSLDIVVSPPFPNSTSLITCQVKQLIRRRYFSDELPPSNPWTVSSVQRSFPSSDEITISEDQSFNHASLSGDPYKYDVLPPLPAQHSLTPPPTLYPQRPMLTPGVNNVPRYSLASAAELSYTRPKRTDINV